jgi:hypothetical protein
LDQALQVGRMRRQVPQTGANGAPRSIDPSHCQQRERASNVLGRQWVAVETRVDKVTDQIVLGLLAVCFDLGVEIGIHAITTGRELLGREVGTLDEVVKKRQEECLVLQRQPDHGRYHAHRDRRCVQRGRVERHALGHGRRQRGQRRAAQRSDFIFFGGDAFGRKSRQ